MSSPSRSQAYLSTINGKGGAQKLEARTQELYQILDEAYLPSDLSTSPGHRNAKHKYTGYVDADGHLHDIDYRPFARLNKPPYPYPRQRRRPQPSSPAYWETFNLIRIEEVENIDPFGLRDLQYEQRPYQGLPFEPGLDTYALPIQHKHSPPLGVYTRKALFAVDGSRRAKVTFVENNIGCRRKSKNDENRVETQRVQRETKDERTAKEKLHHKLFATSLNIRLSAIRTRRWFREHGVH